MTQALDVAIQDNGWRDILPEPDTFCQHVINAAKHHLENPKDGELSIAFVSAAEIRTLNTTYRSKDKPTNVLSFPSSGPAPILGDIIISRETVLAEAQQAQITPQDHTAHLLVHGFLHLHGYDHEVDTDADIMEALETEILHGLNIDNPYKINQRSEP